MVMGYWVESHTLGCRHEAGDEDIWPAHWAIWDEHSKDGKSLLIGDPADGAFLSITPTKDQYHATMGAEMLIELGRRVKKTVPLKVGDEIAARVEEDLAPFVDAAVIAGSVRRRRPEVGDVELVVLPKDLDDLLSHLQEIGFSGGNRIQKGVVHAGPGKYAARVPVEIYIAHKPEEMGAMLFMYTGDFVHNISMRSIAKRRGWKLDQYGIWDAKTGKPLLQSPDERDFYDFLGVDWHDPEDRSFKDRPKKKK
jgi:DNA polymerase/3'-5' exonuclease PolX